MTSPTTALEEKRDQPAQNQRSSFAHEGFAHKLATSLCNGEDKVKIKYIFSRMKEIGILSSDPRLSSLRKLLDRNVDTLSKGDLVNKVIPQNLEMFKKLFAQKLTIPNFDEFKEKIRKIYEATKTNNAGKAADYIPQLAKANPNDFAVSICTVDGQQLHFGEFSKDFSIQSCCKPINYCIAIEQHGSDVVHTYVGKEPSGVEFNAITLDKNQLPHNPCTNAGAIMTCSLIGRDTQEIEPKTADSDSIHTDEDIETETEYDSDKPDDTMSTTSGRTLRTQKSIYRQVLYLKQSSTMSTMHQATFEADRFELVNQIWRKLFAGAKIGFSNSVYLSEKSTGHRNYALGHFMYEQTPGFPENTDLKSVMEFYFQCCSLEVNTENLCKATATLANAGINPFTGQQVFRSETVRNCLSIMFFCGMYDYSGEFAFKIGIPSKSGVAGGLLAVVPGVMGIAIYSPPLDSYGNTVRGVEFLTRLSEEFGFHHFHNVETASETLEDMHMHIPAKSNRAATLQLNDDNEMTKFRILSYAASGDLNALKRLYYKNTNLDVADYDLRTPLHLAASCGHLHIVKFLTSIHKNVNILAIKDRWGGTPFDDAVREKHQHIVNFFAAKAPKIAKVKAGKGKSNKANSGNNLRFVTLQDIKHATSQ